MQGFASLLLTPTVGAGISYARAGTTKIMKLLIIDI
jgi:hypothetical protein